MAIAALVLVASTARASALCASTMPSPFVSPLSLGDNSSVVTILQHLLSRWSTKDAGLCEGFGVTGIYDAATVGCVRALQRSRAVVPAIRAGTVGRPTALEILAVASDDGYVDDGRSASDQGYLYKLLIPVHRNRSIETNATFLDAHNNVLFRFTVRAKGHVVDGCGQAMSEPWPNFNNSGDGLNTFTTDGRTPTGLIEIDPQTPEGDAKLYGPFPVTRFVRGLRGNAAILLPHHRSGILLHTGQWGAAWQPPMSMPNSAGCVHTWPNNVERVWKTALSLGAVIRNNTNGKQPYPYRPQALASVYLVGDLE
jgi:hypothetical protein